MKNYRQPNTIEDGLHFYCCSFVDKETKLRYDKHVSKEAKLQLLRGEFQCPNLDHRMNRRQNKL